MKFLFQAIAIASTAATAVPTLAQDAPQDAVGRLEAMTCREFLALDAAGQATVKAAMLAHLSGEPLPDTPLPAPIGVDAGESAAPDQGRVVEDQTGSVEDGAAVAEGSPGEDAAASDASGTGAPEVAEGENESGKAAPDGTEASVSDEAGDRRLVTMRTSCEGGPDSRASDALRAAFGNNI